MKSENPTAQAYRRYLAHLGIASACYVAFILAATWFVERFEPQGALRLVLLLAPLVPVAFMLPVMVRYFREADEFERRVVTESLAIAAAITAMLSVTYAFLENVGLPHLSAWWTWSVVMGSWLVARFFVARHYGSGFGCNAL